MIARKPRRQRGEKVRYAVVGQGYIAQAAILPAFKHAKNSELAALVSDDPVKLRELGRKYDVAGLYDYRQYDQLLWSEEIDAVFIALPNDMHRDFSVRAAEAGVHVLCEKPMALSEEDCEAMIAAAEDHDVRLMIGYRLHFEEANLRAIEIVQNGEIGEPRYFSSCFSMQVEAGNIRVTAARGGGPLWDIGVYCINAARYLFRDEPIEVQAFAENNGEARFAETPEAVAATLRFPGARLASFVCSFGAADVAEYRVVGTHGDLRVDPAYEYAEGLRHHLTVDGRTRTRRFPKRDQFAAELIYFSDCVLEGRDPEPSGREGLADVRVIRALHRSLRTGGAVELPPFRRRRRPSMEQEIRRPPVRKPELVHAKSPHPDEDD